MTVDNIIDDIHNGDIEDVIQLFGGSLNDVLFFLHKKGRLNEIDPFDDEVEEYQSQILNYMIVEFGIDEVIGYVISSIMKDDFVVNMEGGFDLIINGTDELAELFSESGDPSVRSTVRTIMSEDWFDWNFGYIEVDFQNDIFKNLNEENIGKLKNLLISENIEIDLNKLINSDTPKELLYQLFGEESDIVKLNSDNIDRVFNNIKILDDIIMTYYFETQIEFENLYQRSYSDAWVEDVTNQIWVELSTYFNVKDKRWVPTPNNESHYFRMGMNDGVVVDAILSFLTEHTERDYYGENSISGFSGIIGLLQYLMEVGIYDFLTIRPPDYPDYSLVVKNINLGFDDYF